MNRMYLTLDSVKNAMLENGHTQNETDRILETVLNAEIERQLTQRKESLMHNKERYLRTGQHYANRPTAFMDDEASYSHRNGKVS